MRHYNQRIIGYLIFLCFLSSNEIFARQNIIIGEVSTGYDFRDRDYTSESGNRTNEGDTRDFIVSPRIRYSSRGASDLLEFTYAPSFTYDDLYNENFTGHNFNLNAEKHLSRDWLIRATNSYFKGEDTSIDYEQRQAAIIPGEETTPEPDSGAEQPADTPQELSDDYGRRRFWRNDFAIRTDYTYAQDSVIGAGYVFGVLRNESDSPTNDYSDHDRHEISTHLSYRFNTQWQSSTELRYVKGLYDDEPTISEDSLSDDLEEYHARIRTNFALRPHDIFFGQYAYSETLYDDAEREDSAFHDLTFGWDHDFSRRLRMTLSGGPSFLVPENGANESGYNAYAGFIWDFRHSSLTANTSYAYEYDNFDGTRSGLTKAWSNTLRYSYRFTPNFETSFHLGYEKRDREEPSGILIVADDDRFGYTEKTYSTSLSLRYSFLRWYTLTFTYGYADNQEPEENYDEHRVFLNLAASTDLFRW